MGSLLFLGENGQHDTLGQLDITQGQEISLLHGINVHISTTARALERVQLNIILSTS